MYSGSGASSGCAHIDICHLLAIQTLYFRHRRRLAVQRYGGRTEGEALQGML